MMQHHRSAQPNVFISYSGRYTPDMPWIADFLDFVDMQPLNLWLYQDEDQAIPAGAHILDYCRKKIACSQVFVPLVTQTALDSEYTREEVAFALEHADQLNIVPIVDTKLGVPISDFPSPYGALLGLECGRRAVFADLRTRNGQHEAVLNLCHAAGVDFRDSSQAQRMPLGFRIRNELQQQLPIIYKYQFGTCIRIMRDADRCEQAFLRADDTRAVELFRWVMADIERLEENLRDEHAVAIRPFYYPRLLQAVFELKVRADAAECRARLSYLEQNLPEALDENFHALKGHLAVRENDFATGYAHYLVAREAFRRSRGNDHQEDAHILYNILLCAIQLGHRIEPFITEGLTMALHDTVFGYSDQDKRRFATLLALVEIYSGRNHNIRWSEIDLSQCEDLCTLVMESMAEACLKNNDPDKLRTLLGQVEQLIPRDEILGSHAAELIADGTGKRQKALHFETHLDIKHRVAFYYRELGQPTAALRHYETLNSLVASSRWLSEAAQVHLDLGDRESAMQAYRKATMPHPGIGKLTRSRIADIAGRPINQQEEVEMEELRFARAALDACTQAGGMGAGVQ